MSTYTDPEAGERASPSWSERVAAEEADRAAADLSRRDLLARGGHTTVELWQTPLRSVVTEITRGPDGALESAQAVGEIWG